MKYLLCLKLICLLGFTALAQDAIRYQGVAYGSDNLPISSTAISVQFTVIQGSISGPEVHSENHRIITQSDGSFVALLGRGNPSGTSFSDIDWIQGRHFLNVGIDINNGIEFQNMGTTEFLSVPYAFHARVAQYGPRGYRGFRGDTGPSGADGDVGEMGLPGSDVPWNGPIGPRGEIGLNGPQGPQGLQGPPGADGDPNGPKGPRGEVGPQGPRGLNGPEGPAGRQGDTGDMGIQGPTGFQGERGDTGIQGIGGPQGDSKGDPGPAGPAGPSANQAPCFVSWGPEGPPGPQGLSCWDINGNGIGDLAEDTNGDGAFTAHDCQGLEGPQGDMGPAGPSGISGLPIEELLSSPPAKVLHRIYLDNGTNRADGRPGFRYYDGQTWIDLY